jgi:putative heme-binding domain-containing protein
MPNQHQAEMNAVTRTRRRELAKMRAFNGDWQVFAICTAIFALLTLCGAAAPPDAKKAENDDGALARGKRVFEIQCARCHGIQGTGGTGASLARPTLRNATTDQDLLTVIKDGIEGTAMPPNWFLTDPQARDVAGYVRSLGRGEAQPLPGDAALGEQVYAKNECAKCHTIAGEGGSLGPDLTDVGARRGLDFLRAAVLHPGRESPLDEWGYVKYLAVVAMRDDGRVVSGMRVNEDTFTIQLRDEKNHFQSLEKRALEGLNKGTASVMPAYDKVLSTADGDHLVSYLSRLRGAAP